MTTLQDYIEENYNDRETFFKEEVNRMDNVKRVNEIIDIKEFLEGKNHSILNSQTEEYKGKTYYPATIVLNYAKTICNFQTNFLLKNPVSLTCSNEGLLNRVKEVYDIGNYDRIDFDILDKVVKYGNAYEYPYISEDGYIYSKIIPPEDGYPIFSEFGNEYIGFIESYTVDNVTFWVVFTEDKVEEYSNKGGKIHKIGEYENVSGLPCIYKSDNELDENFGRSDVLRFGEIIEEMERLISRSCDGLYKYMDGLPIMSGQQLEGEEGVNPKIAGEGLNLEDGAEFYFANNEINERAFKEIYNTLKQALLDISQTPAVAFNQTDISNLSEVSIRMMYTLASMKGSLNEKFMREGFEQRFDRFKRLLDYKGENYEGWETLDAVFHPALPRNDNEVIDNLQKLDDMGAISLDTLLDKNPYVNDKNFEKKRLEESNDNGNSEE
ncbi:phage portal protein [Natranaerobius thermophilus]|uniref:Portal protein SPP1 n=1 Tax=Natranaerobius thermophilus (strain ATCC BAA-1301 / DSM 18059 / JW/NM-WN-LF) TaxID=457570 RepID=B2A206_NATTJ|nr:phage portal protein [Natranaerobius thermophilus]ACB84811.1 portal protein SPP1 [Natranaerobius thermophilus JW/NM-WN-LF]